MFDEDRVRAAVLRSSGHQVSGGHVPDREGTQRRPETRTWEEAIDELLGDHRALRRAEAHAPDQEGPQRRPETRTWDEVIAELLEDHGAFDDAESQAAAGFVDHHRG